MKKTPYIRVAHLSSEKELAAKSKQGLIVILTKKVYNYGTKRVGIIKYALTMKGIENEISNKG